MTFGNLVSIFRARWRLVLLVLALTTATAAVVSFMLPKKFMAFASVVVDAKPDPISALIYPGLASPAYINTQVDVINSERVALRVVHDLKLASNPEIRQQWQDKTNGEGSIEQWLTAALQKGMDVKPSKESNVLTVSYQAPDARFAADLANAFVQAYLATTLELRVDPARQYASYFDERSKAARQVLEAAQTRLSAFQRENGIIASDERLDVEGARLNELSSQLVAVQALSAESGSRQTLAAGASADRMAEVLNNPAILQLKADISRAESRLQELSARYGDKHPQVIEAKASLTESRGRLEAETRRVSGGAAVSNTINRQREAEVRASLESQRGKVLRMKAVRDEAAVLMRDVESAQRAFESVTARLSQTNLESQNTQSNVNVLTTAVPPAQPASPNVPLNIALALVVGTVLGLGIALMLELRDRRVRTDDDVLLGLQLPLLGVLPKPAARVGRGAGRLHQMEQRLLGHGAAGSSSRAA